MKKIFLSYTRRPTLLIFGIYHHLVNLYQVCSNYIAWAKNGHAPGHMFYIGLYRGNVKKSSCLKPQGLEPWYLVYSITKWTSTKFVQILALGPGMARPRGLMFDIGLYRENVEKSSSLKPEGLDY